jgi:hypothetical protein
VVAPIVAHGELGRQLDAARLQLGAERARAKRPPWLVIGFGTAFVVIGALGAAAPIAFLLSRPNIEDGVALSVGLMIIAYGGIASGVAVGVVRGMRNTRLRLAIKPFAEVHATDTLSLACPSCGAGIAVGRDDVVGACAHCGTASLLPAAFLPKQLQRKHARLLALRGRFTDVREAASSITDTVNEAVGYAMIAIGVLGFLLFVVVALRPGFAPHLSGVERVMMVLCSGGMVLGLFGGFGVMNVRSSKKRGRRRTG